MSWDGRERRKGPRELEEQIIAHMATANEKLSNIEGKVSAIDTKVGIQNGRVTKLETWQASLNGKIIGISAAFSFFGVIAGYIISILK